jgi:hypothetical protein
MDLAWISEFIMVWVVRREPEGQRDERKPVLPARKVPLEAPTAVPICLVARGRHRTILMEVLPQPPMLFGIAIAVGELEMGEVGEVEERAYAFEAASEPIWDICSFLGEKRVHMGQRCKVQMCQMNGSALTV